MTDKNHTPRGGSEQPGDALRKETPESAGSAAPGTRKVAIALEYDDGSHRAPRITATGAGAIADQILEIAFAQGVKVHEDADLAEVLSALDVDSIIPTEVLAAVAEILSYVYRTNREALLTEMQT